MSATRPVVAVDAMGGDKAPAEIVAGAIEAAASLDVDVLLVGTKDDVEASLPGGAPPEHVELLATTEVIAMDDEPASAVRTRKDSSIVQAAKAVRDGRADAMLGAGNTGATMAAALLRMGRIKGVARPAIGVPVPVPGSHPQLLVDAGAAVDCAPEWLVQSAHLGRAYASLRFEVPEPRVGLLSNGEEPGKGDDLRKRVYPLLEGVPGFVGNVEGRDFLHEGVDVIVTDGFTGNVALKTIEGSLRAMAKMVFDVVARHPEVTDTVVPDLLAAADAFDPDSEGGAALLGVDGVCVISHGSSSARAIVNAIGVAAACVRGDVVSKMKEAVSDAG